MLTLLAPLLILIISFATHFVFFGLPHEVVFDEVFNGKFLEAYRQGMYFFDVHPALPKLLTFLLGNFTGIPAGIDFSIIGNPLPPEIIILRILPLIAGTLLPLILYYICRYLNISVLGSFTMGILLCFENSLIIQSRFILYDSFLHIFGFSSILLYLIYSKYSDRKYIIWLSALLAAGAICTKWTGLAFPLLIFIMEMIRTKKIRDMIKFSIPYILVGIVMYISVFAIHFSLLPRSGTGDVFMTERFQKTLTGNIYENDPTYKPKGFFGKFFELNVKMVETGVTENNFASKWYTWPLMKRSMFYWQNFNAGQYIYLIGNPLLYWLGTLSILILALYTFIKKRFTNTALFILIGYSVNFFPFMLIHRPMFIYHYQAALIFSIMAIIYLIEQFSAQKKIYIGLIVASFIVFLFFSPITYGLPITQEQLDMRMWFPSWR